MRLNFLEKMYAAFIVAALFMFSTPVSAQTFQSGGAINAAPDVDTATGCGGKSFFNWKPQSSYTCTLTLTTPCTIILESRYPMTTAQIVDQHGTVFALASGNPGQYDEVWYSTSACLSGSDTITVQSNNGWGEWVFASYSGALMPDQISQELQDVTGIVSWSNPITAPSGELVIGYGSNHTHNNVGMTAGPGFSLREFANAFFEDEISPGGSVTAAVTYSSSVAWCQGIISFKTTAQQPYVLTLNGIIFTFPMQMPPVCGATNAPCSMQIQILDGNGNQLALGTSGQINLVMTWTPNGTSQAVTIPVVIAKPASQ